MVHRHIIKDHTVCRVWRWRISWKFSCSNILVELMWCMLLT